jgi:hypothetical protein
MHEMYDRPFSDARRGVENSYPIVKWRGAEFQACILKSSL